METENSFKQLVSMMVTSDLRLAHEEKLVATGREMAIA